MPSKVVDPQVGAEPALRRSSVDPVKGGKAVRFVSLLLFVLTGSVLSAQSPDLAFEHYTTDQGLSHETVLSIMKDRQGFMWFGTADGLNRFDGREFRKVFPSDYGLPYNAVRASWQAPDDWIWVGSQSGLCRLNPYSWELRPLRLPEMQDSVPDNEDVSSLEFDHDGQHLWFATPENLYKMDWRTYQYQRWPLPLKLPEHLLQVVLDSKGRLWLELMSAIYRFDERTGKFTHYAGRDGLHPFDPLLSGRPYEDHQGRLFLPTWGYGLQLYDEARDTFISAPPYHAIVTTLVEAYTPEGKPFFWAGGGHHGLQQIFFEEDITYHFAFDALNPFSHNESMLMRPFYDAETGITWLGTEKGIEKYDPRSILFQRKMIPEFIERNLFSEVSAVVQDRWDADLYWIAVWGKGMVRWRRSTDEFKHFDHRNSPMPTSEVFDMVQAPDGKLWMSCFGGFCSYDPQFDRWEKHFGFATTPNINHKFLSICCDHAGVIWVGANYEGLWSFDPKTKALQRWRLPDDRPSAGPKRELHNCIVEDSLHQIWSACSAGLVRVDADRRQVDLLDITGKKYEAVGYLFVARNGHLWVAGTMDLYEMNPETGRVLRQFGQKDGIRSVILGIREDASGQLWLPTDNFLHRLDPASGRVQYFKKEDGLFSNRLGSSLATNRQGEFFLGFEHGFNYFHPAHLSASFPAPRVALTSLEIMNHQRAYVPEQPIVLQPGEDVITFHFAGLNYSRPDRIRYAYQLEGFDKKWVETRERQATYTNLDGGRYTFRVRVATGDSTWSEPLLVQPLRVQPPFQKTLLFKILLVLLSAGIVTGVTRYRLEQRRRIREIRNRIARDLHDDMGSTLSSIRIISSVLQQQVNGSAPNAVPMLARISESAAALSESMQDIIWTIKTDRDTVKDLVARAHEFALKILEARGIVFHADVSEHLETAKLNLAQRRNLYLIFKEIINNAAKYAGCKAIHLTIRIVGKTFTMIISDDGCGFDATGNGEAKHGHGLQNIQQRAAEIGATATLETVPGKGTKWVVSVKLA